MLNCQLLYLPDHMVGDSGQHGDHLDETLRDGERTVGGYDPGSIRFATKYHVQKTKLHSE